MMNQHDKNRYTMKEFLLSLMIDAKLDISAFINKFSIYTPDLMAYEQTQQYRLWHADTHKHGFKRTVQAV